MATYTYSPNDCYVNRGGVDIDFNKAVCKSATETVKHKQGTRGEVVFNIARADPVQEVTLTIPASSRANFLLNAQFDAEQAGGPAQPFTVVNTNGAAVSIPQSRIKMKPGPDLGEEAGDTEWVIFGQGKILQAGATI